MHSQSWPTLYNRVGSSIHGTLQAKILEWVTIPPPGDLPDPGIELGSPALQTDSLPTEPSGKPLVGEEVCKWSLYLVVKEFFQDNLELKQTITV